MRKNLDGTPPALMDSPDDSPHRVDATQGYKRTSPITSQASRPYEAPRPARARNIYHAMRHLRIRKYLGFIFGQSSQPVCFEPETRFNHSKSATLFFTPSKIAYICVEAGYQRNRSRLP